MAASFAFELGRSTSGVGENAATHIVRGTQPSDSKTTVQKIRLELQMATAEGTSYRSLTVNTGKYKTVAQLSAIVADIFQRFLSGPVLAGQEFGKIGDAKYGGEIRFVADSPDRLRYNIISPVGPAPGSGQLDRAGVAAFHEILVGIPGR